MIELGGISLDTADPAVQAGLAGAAVLLLMLALLLAAFLAARRSARTTEALVQGLTAMGAQVQHSVGRPAKLTGGLRGVAEAQAAAQAQTLALVERRLEEVQRAMGDSLTGSATRTARSLGELQQRLEAIDRAQSNIEKLSGDVLGLQDILSNKQTRGAFGEIQLHDIVARALPPDAYAFQATLSNGKRADCLIRLPDPPGPLAIDAKFPLEPYEAIRAATTPAEATEAARQMRAAMRAHIRAIAEKYIVEGETAEGALMFVPSEAVYAELHANFAEQVREGFAARVWIVSPTTCMATLNTLRAVLKDAQMRPAGRRDPPRIGALAQGCGPAGRPGRQPRPAFRPGPAGYRGDQDFGRQGGTAGGAARKLRVRGRPGRAGGAAQRRGVGGRASVLC
jgi:DNA recombination protein RmuC